MNQIIAGNAAIPFTAKDIDGNTVNLATYKGKKVYLVFFRKAACPFCNMGLRELIQKNEELEARGIKVVALFASPKEELLQYAGKQKAPFPIIPDGDYTVYKKYAVGSSYGGMLKTMFHPGKVAKAMTGGFFSLKSTFQAPVLPADFLIDEDQTIVKAHYGTSYDDHLSVSEVLNWEVALQQAA